MLTGLLVATGLAITGGRELAATGVTELSVTGATEGTVLGTTDGVAGNGGAEAPATTGATDAVTAGIGATLLAGLALGSTEETVAVIVAAPGDSPGTAKPSLASVKLGGRISSAGPSRIAGLGPIGGGTCASDKMDVVARFLPLSWFNHPRS